MILPRLFVVLLFFAVLVPPAVRATDFQWNFASHGNRHAFQGEGGFCNAGATCQGNDGTRFIQDTLWVGGRYYFHTVIGNPASGFALEYYTEKSLNLDWFDFSPYSGGNERTVMGNTTSWRKGNNYDPLGVSVDPSTGFKGFDLSGTGTMNPTRAVLRMVLSDKDVSMEVFKPLLTRKPKISQTTVGQDMTGQVVIDMRGLSYSEANRAAPVVNNLSITDPDLPKAGIADFSMEFAQRSTVTAGRFTFAPGVGWNDPAKGWNVDNSTFGEGTYTHAGGDSFDVFSLDWGSFFDYSQNEQACNKGARINAICPGRP